MKPDLDPRLLLVLAGVLLLAGFLLPLLMVLQVIESTFFLNFFAFTAMTLGSVLGFIGAVSLGVARRGRR